MKTLITGAAGFIGAALVERLLASGEHVVGLDNHNDYYDPKIKQARLDRFSSSANYEHAKIDLTDRDRLNKLFQNHKPYRVVNLAAQAGVRYSIDNPSAYIDSNLVGFANILECCRQYNVEHLVYASSSSVYGSNTSMPYSTHHEAGHPLSLYAATKRANELMAHSYSHLYQIPTTGLRFFTVYGPWGRPDMALFKFTKSILADEKITVFNNGKHRRDFTYIDDIIEGINLILKRPAAGVFPWDSENPDPATSKAPWRIYNIGNSTPIDLMKFIEVLEKILGRKAKIDFLPLQDGDVAATCADIDDLMVNFSFTPRISIEQGIEEFVNWYRSYYNV